MHELLQFGHQMLEPLVRDLQRIPFLQHRKNSGALFFGDGGKVEDRGAGHDPILP